LTAGLIQGTFNQHTFQLILRPADEVHATTCQFRPGPFTQQVRPLVTTADHFSSNHDFGRDIGWKYLFTRRHYAQLPAKIL